MSDSQQPARAPNKAHFYRRLDLGDRVGSGVVPLQAAVALENLLGRYPFQLRTWRHSYKPTAELAAPDFVAGLEALGSEFSATVLVEHRAALPVYSAIIAPDWVLCISCEYKVRYADDDDAYGELLSLREVQAELVARSDEPEKPAIFAALAKLGLETTAPDRKTKVSVQFAFPGPRGTETQYRDFDLLRFDAIKQNYTPNVVEKVEAAIAAIHEAKHGLVLLSGPVGVGKSYLLKAIISESRERQAVVCSPPTAFLSDVGRLVGAANATEKSLVVLEDIGDLLSVEAPTSHIDSTSNILNLSEGLLSLLTDTVLVVSFNYDLGKIDPAITRVGRCLAQIYVGPLPHAQAQGLVEFDIPQDNYTLAEVYEMRRLGRPLTGVERVGSPGAKRATGFGRA